MSDGSDLAVSENAQWTSQNPDIARIDAQGTLNALRDGQTTITASVKGATAALAVTVVMDLTGLWRITYIPVSCPSYRVPGCSGRHIPRPTQDTDLLSVTQTGDRITGDGWMETEGRITPAGQLVLNGRRCYSSDHAFDSEAIVRDWEMDRTAGTDIFTGRAHWEYASIEGQWGQGLCAGKRISSTHAAGDLRIIEFRRIEK